MGIRDRKYIFYVLAMLLVLVIPMFNPVFEFKLFVHDFSKILPDGNTVFHAFFYHLGLMLRPTIMAALIFAHAKGVWKIVALVSLLWLVKDCFDVILDNNQADTFWIDFTGYVLIISITLIAWVRYRNITKQS